MQMEEHFGIYVKLIMDVLRELLQCVTLTHGLGRTAVGKREGLKDLIECIQSACQWSCLTEPCA